MAVADNNSPDATAFIESLPTTETCKGFRFPGLALYLQAYYTRKRVPHVTAQLMRSDYVGDHEHVIRRLSFFESFALAGTEVSVSTTLRRVAGSQRLVRWAVPAVSWPKAAAGSASAVLYLAREQDYYMPMTLLPLLSPEDVPQLPEFVYDFRLVDVTQ